MRIATLQYSPSLGEVTSNIARANNILSIYNPQSLHLLVLPELAFTGYNHPSLASVHPYLEPTAAGPTTIWAKATAARLNCIVTVGYPELYTPSANISTPSVSGNEKVTAYNSTITVSPTGTILAHYRKTHLYYTDETWAQESPTGWLTASLPFPSSQTLSTNETHNEEVKAAFGICMDLNPHHFTAPWDAYEFASSSLSSGADMLILSMAWLTNLPSESLKEHKEEPDLDTLKYWIERLKPLVQGEKEILVVCANRCGEEPGGDPLGRGDGGVRYAGSSWVGRVGRVGAGDVGMWEILGRGNEGLCVVDTGEECRWKLKVGEGEEEG